MSETKNLPHGGLLIVTLPEQGAVGALSSHYFDPRAKQGKIRDALIKWFTLWGIPLSRSTSNPTWLEAHTAEVVWCDAAPAHLHGPQTVKYYVETGDRVVNAIKASEPKVILVLSAYLYEAMASDPLASRITEVIGKAKSAPRRITAMRLKAMEQTFEHARMLILPTPSKNTTDDYVQSLTAAVRENFEAAGFDLDDKGDALLTAARELLVMDEARTLLTLQNRLRIDEQRARKLLDALEEKGVITRSDESGRRFFKGQN